MTTHIGPTPPPEMFASGLSIDCRCARCGSSRGWFECEASECDGGAVLTVDGDDDEECYEPCNVCEGEGGLYVCLSSPEWCKANPLPGREGVQRGSIEWFTVKEPC